MTTSIALSGASAAGRVALVDDASWELVKDYRWFVWESRGIGPYAIANTRRPDGGKTTLKMHKLITGWPQTDHKDRNGLNNQWYNLREVTHRLNQGNRRKPPGCSSQFKGACWDKRAGKWMAYIRDRGRFIFLGYFAEEEDAALAYDDAAKDVFGDFALCNFP